ISTGDVNAQEMIRKAEQRQEGDRDSLRESLGHRSLLRSRTNSATSRVSGRATPKGTLTRVGAHATRAVRTRAMGKYDQTLFLVNAPASPSQAEDLSTQITLRFGDDGFRVVSVVTIGDPPSVLMAFERLRDLPHRGRLPRRPKEVVMRSRAEHGTG